MSEHLAETDECARCGHGSRHDERWGCMAEVGDGGSGSVADAVFCECERFVRKVDCGCEWDAIPPNVACPIHSDRVTTPPGVTATEGQP